MQRTDAESAVDASPCLAGIRIAFTGRLASMTQREAEALSEQHGAVATESVSARTDLLVVGEEGWPLLEGGQVTQDCTAGMPAALVVVTIRWKKVQESPGPVGGVPSAASLGLPLKSRRGSSPA